MMAGVRVERSTTSTVGREAELATLLRAARSEPPGCCWSPATPGSARPGWSRRPWPGCAPTAGGSWSGTAWTSARSRCPTSPSPRWSTRCPASCPASCPAASPRRSPVSVAAAPVPARQPRGRAEVLDAVLALVEALCRDAPAGGRARGRALGRPQHARPGRVPARPAARGTRAPACSPTAPTSCTAATRCAPALAEWVRLAGRRAGAARPAARRRRARAGRGARRPPGDGDASASRRRPRARGGSAPRATRSTSRSSSVRFLDGGGRLPDDLADLLLVRLDRLGDDAREVVRVASAAGQRVPHDLLARVVDLDERDLEAALREAVDARVLVRSGATAYAFRHALLGEAVHDDLLPGERARLHTAYAAAVRELARRDRRRPRPARPGLPRPAHRAGGLGRRPARRRWPGAAPTRRPSTSPPRWRSTRGAAAGLDDPPDAGRPGGPDGRGAGDRRPARRRRWPWSTTTCGWLPADAPPAARGPGCCWPAFEVLRATEADARPSLVTAEGLALVGPGRRRCAPGCWPVTPTRWSGTTTSPAPGAAAERGDRAGRRAGPRRRSPPTPASR